MYCWNTDKNMQYDSRSGMNLHVMIYIEDGIMIKIELALDVDIRHRTLI
jgi:hypothetical protein